MLFSFSNNSRDHHGAISKILVYICVHIGSTLGLYVQYELSIQFRAVGIEEAQGHPMHPSTDLYRWPWSWEYFHLQSLQGIECIIFYSQLWVVLLPFTPYMGILFPGPESNEFLGVWDWGRLLEKWYRVVNHQGFCSILLVHFN